MPLHLIDKSSPLQPKSSGCAIPPSDHPSGCFTHRCPMEYHPKSIAEGGQPMTTTIDGRPQAMQPGERLIDLINRCRIDVPQRCYHPQLGPIQTCDTCIVEVDAKLLARIA